MANRVRIVDASRHLVGAAAPEKFARPATRLVKRARSLTLAFHCTERRRSFDRPVGHGWGRCSCPGPARASNGALAWADVSKVIAAWQQNL